MRGEYKKVLWFHALNTILLSSFSINFSLLIKLVETSSSHYRETAIFLNIFPLSLCHSHSFSIVQWRLELFLLSGFESFSGFSFFVAWTRISLKVLFQRQFLELEILVYEVLTVKFTCELNLRKIKFINSHFNGLLFKLACG